jgi:hypothetical protein
MKTKIQIKSILGKLLFEFECENNSIKKTVENANFSGDSLRYANLIGADLSGVDLIGADLRNANLRYANLRDANLRDAYLRGADLRYANFSGANLRDADLRGADLENADLANSNLSGAYLENADLENADLSGADISGAKDKEMAYLPIHCKLPHSIVGDKIQIGREEKTIEEWENFFNSDEIFSIERNTFEFKQIQAVFEAYKGYLNFLNK